jgi:hypothetical protein
MYWFIAIEVAIVVVLICIGFVTPFDINRDMTWKQWLQIVGVALIVAAITSGRQYPWRFHPRMFLAGLLIFASTFLTWKRKEDGDD